MSTGAGVVQHLRTTIEDTQAIIVRGRSVSAGAVWACYSMTGPQCAHVGLALLKRHGRKATQSHDQSIRVSRISLAGTRYAAAYRAGSFDC